MRHTQAQPVFANMLVAVTLQTWRVCFTAQQRRHPARAQGRHVQPPMPTKQCHAAGCRLGRRYRLGKVLQTLTVLLASGECCRGTLAAVHCAVSRSHSMLSGQSFTCACMQCCQGNHSLAPVCHTPLHAKTCITRHDNRSFCPMNSREVVGVFSASMLRQQCRRQHGAQRVCCPAVWLGSHRSASTVWQATVVIGFHRFSGANMQASDEMAVSGSPGPHGRAAATSSACRAPHACPTLLWRLLCLIYEHFVQAQGPAAYMFCRPLQRCLQGAEARRSSPLKNNS